MSSYDTNTTTATTVPKVLIVLAWLWVIIPFTYGLWQLLIKIPALFSP